MKRPMKRLLCLLAAGMLALGPAGCGQDSEQAKEESAASGESGQEAEDTPFSSFTAKDLEGNEVNQDILQQAEVTMINIWGTFCGPCIREMPDLGELSREYEGKGLQIVGIPVDVNGQSNLDTAKRIIEETGADYLHILPSQDLNVAYLNTVQAVPQTLFVDQEGRIISEHLGAQSKDQWKGIIDKALGN